MPIEEASAVVSPLKLPKGQTDNNFLKTKLD